MTDAGRKDLLKRALTRIEALEARLAAGPEPDTEPLAVVGIGCRFPGGANDPWAFWERLNAGVDATGEIPPDRWDVERYYDPDPEARGKMYTRRGAFLDTRVDEFDPQFFGIAPREADAMDPQQRLLLEVVWETLERAGQAPGRLSGSATGVFVGMTAHDWSHIQDRGTDTAYIDTYYGTGTSHSVAAGRIAYLLGLKGPAVTLDTACSSSLVALHAASQSLRLHETRAAIVAGVLLMLTPNGHVIASSGRMLSADGRCKTFDASADGYARGEGCGVVLLKRLADAEADGDRVLALVRGTAINQDGRSAGLTAPNARAQEEVIRAALAASGIEPGLVGYLEAHGTGTELGDPIEMQSLAAVFGGRGRTEPLYVGSVKTNIGHLESAAGIAGVIKTVLALQHGTIPPHLHRETPNPHIPWDRLPFEVPDHPLTWKPRDGRLVAGVSSFGFSGTNAHVVLEGPSRLAPPVPEADAPSVLVLSARTPAALEQAAARIADHVENRRELASSAVTATLATGRDHWEHRAATVVGDHAELVASLRAVASGGAGPLRGEATIKRPPRVAFLFTGQGSQRPGMGRALLAADAVFRREMQRCDEVLAPLLGRSILELIEADDDDREAAALLAQTQFTQPALFALEWALARMWRSWGVEPSIVLGHSLGEYVAACLAGVFELEHALRVVAERGRLIGGLPPGGAMAAVFADERTVRELVPDLDVAAVNGPENTVLSGEAAAIEAALRTLSARGIEGRRLVVSHAFHSAAMDPVLEAFHGCVSAVVCRAPRLDMILNTTGALASGTSLDADYWTRHLREPVRFADSVAALRRAGVDILLEVGPAPVLLGLAAASPSDAGEVHVASLRPGQDAAQSIREALARLYVAGAPLAWDRIATRGTPIELPTYAFQRERHWPVLRPARRSGDAEHALLGTRVESPRLAGEVHEAVLSEGDPQWTGDHRVFGRAVLPGAAYLEMAVAATRGAGGPKRDIVEARILEPLVLDVERRVQTLVDDDRIEIVSRAAAGGPWQTHFTARAAAAVPAEALSWPSAAEGEEWDPADYLARIRAGGVEYAGAFRSCVRIVRGDGWAAGEIDASIVPSSERRAYGIHPGLLDAAFQLCGACFESPDNTVYLPVKLGRFSGSLSAAAIAADRLEARAALREGGAGAARLVCDIEIGPVADGSSIRVTGLEFQRAAAPEAAIERRVRDWLYTVDWLETELGRASEGSGRWLVVGDGADARAVAACLEAKGRCAELSESARAAVLAGGCEGVVVVVAGGALEGRGGPALRPALEALLEAGRAAAGIGRPPRLRVVTRAAFALDANEDVDPAAAAVWGLGQAIAAEIAAAGCRRLDLPAGTVLPDDLADAILAEDAEERLAYRDGIWHVARLVRHGDDGRRGASGRPAGGYRLEIAERGALEGLAFGPAAPEPPAADEIGLRVRATGLNFRDVLNVLGMYPGDAGALGSECVGTVEAVGSGVHDLAPGDEVMAITPRGFCSHVNARAALAVRVPDGVSLGAAASLPIAFLTADWALNELGALRDGERVLIHAGAGGVGMAAIQLARAVGAEVFATAGSDRKRAVLRRMGVQRIYDSRSLEFRERILEDTNGEGVHVVLNSLADEFIPASFDVLRSGGRFLEIGRTGVLDADEVRESRPDSEYHVIYLGEACEREPERVRARWLALCERFAAGELHPLPVHAFAVDDAVDAFRFMAQARHVGKVVLFDSVGDADAMGTGAAWITGGTGGLGLALAADLAGRGCRRIALSGRSRPDEAAASRITALRERGVDVLVVSCDVADEAGVREARAAIEARGWSIRHVYHAAGVLDDGVLASQSWERFETVLRPKAAGAWNLHRATIDLPLESFVLFSAGAALLGARGQANYAAANAFLDGFARWRWARGLPALSVAWGPWASVGMAARSDLDWSAQGLDAIQPEQGVAALRCLQRDGAVYAAVLPIDWKRHRAAAQNRGDPFFDRLVEPGRTAGPDGAESWLALLGGVSPGERRASLERLLGAEVGRVLGLDAARLPTRRQGLTDMGVDSLMAVELANRLNRALQLGLPTTLVFEYPTLESMAAYLMEELGWSDTAGDGPDAAANGAGGDADAAAGMSADEVSAALLDELDKIGY